jgi:hypothetical protein
MRGFHRHAKKGLATSQSFLKSDTHFRIPLKEDTDE